MSALSLSTTRLGWTTALTGVLGYYDKEIIISVKGFIVQAPCLNIWVHGILEKILCP